MTNDTVSGHVTVSEGAYSGDSITATNDAFGATSLSQNGGNGDTITVDPSNVLNLTITQGNGDGDSIVVDNVNVSIASFGVVTTQGTGIGDSTSIDTVNTYGTVENPHFVPSISVTQNDVYLLDGLVGDTASVNNSNVPGSISISQGGSNLDSASITNSTAEFFGVSISQLSGNSDSAAIINVSAGGAVSITQGDGGISLPLFPVGDSAVSSTSLPAVL